MAWIKLYVSVYTVLTQWFAEGTVPFHLFTEDCLWPRSWSIWLGKIQNSIFQNFQLSEEKRVNSTDEWFHYSRKWLSWTFSKSLNKVLYEENLSLHGMENLRLSTKKNNCKQSSEEFPVTKLLSTNAWLFFIFLSLLFFIILSILWLNGGVSTD